MLDDRTQLVHTTTVITFPLIDGNNTLYIRASDGNLYALTNGGKIKWVFSAGSSIDSAAPTAPSTSPTTAD
ncbi:PQQ-binding-like beta-propeller repeat protein [Pedosphaera parvula]|uniref:PQQ-binding-like beta-propeller repeat protein n=1 Tax=Pedosphaera parvula TaxID=1032527 RepID=UPI0002E9F79B|nr:PQQ-binding-like beta-propeller repeat protein [Pedosphaera parvula]